MKTYSRILIFSVLVWAACSGEKGKDEPLSRQEMVPLVYQLMLADEISLDYHNRDSTKKTDSIRFRKYDQIFDLNQVDYHRFKSSYEYYLARPDQLRLIFDSVEALGNRDRLARMNPSTAEPVVKSQKSIKTLKDSTNLRDTTTKKDPRTRKAE